MPWQAVKHSHLRFTKENPRNHTEKQLKDLLGEMSKDERSERAEVVRQQILVWTPTYPRYATPGSYYGPVWWTQEQEKKALQENLDVPNGVRAFADDFLNLMDASGDPYPRLALSPRAPTGTDANPPPKKPRKARV